MMLQQMAEVYPYVTEMATQLTHDADTTVGVVCDDQFEFEFGLDLILDGDGAASKPPGDLIEREIAA